jgi:hypothetical protein
VIREQLQHQIKNAVLRSTIHEIIILIFGVGSPPVEFLECSRNPLESGFECEMEERGGSTNLGHYLNSIALNIR